MVIMVMHTCDAQPIFACNARLLYNKGGVKSIKMLYMLTNKYAEGTNKSLLLTYKNEVRAYGYAS